ncbi:MAG: DUF6527 family protein [Acidimicrobiia bacterium]|nr:DUF6527 family protein [Acidimicrobiia bacterium]
MTRLERLDHRFVDWIPPDLEPGVLYITIEYATAVHSCACGCRARVVTPLTLKDWELRFDGETVSLSPSIGNWSFACQSHYWIRQNRIEWAPRWSAAQIGGARELARAPWTSSLATPRASSGMEPASGRLVRLLRRLARAVRGT